MNWKWLNIKTFVSWESSLSWFHWSSSGRACELSSHSRFTRLTLSLFLSSLQVMAVWPFAQRREDWEWVSCRCMCCHVISQLKSVNSLWFRPYFHFVINARFFIRYKGTAGVSWPSTKGFEERLNHSVWFTQRYNQIERTLRKSSAANATVSFLASKFAAARVLMKSQTQSADWSSIKRSDLVVIENVWQSYILSRIQCAKFCNSI